MPITDAQKTAFAKALTKKITQAAHKQYTDNHQKFYQDGDLAVQEEDSRWLAEHPVFDIKTKDPAYHTAFEEQVQTKALLYSLLAEPVSRELLLDLAAFSLLGHRRVRLPYYEKSNHTLRTALLEKTHCPDKADKKILAAVREKWGTDLFSLFSFTLEGHQYQMYTIGEELFRRHYKPSYVWQQGRQAIQVEKGDIVLDCGTAFGDVSLQFAHAAGSAGRVICFEPYPLFLQVYHENMRMNPTLAQRTTLLERGVWHTSDETLSFITGGGGSRIDESNRAGYKIQTVSIDDTVDFLQLDRVDFIKMDIEGAELSALQGAVRTLRRFRPKLALCLYHFPQDFHEIPAYINALDLGGKSYTFHLNHHYINEWETVLYAACNE